MTRLTRTSAQHRMHQILAAMRPGHWYSTATMARTLRMTVDTTRLYLQRLHKQHRLSRRHETWPEFYDRLAAMPRAAPKRGAHRVLLYGHGDEGKA